MRRTIDKKRRPRAARLGQLSHWRTGLLTQPLALLTACALGPQARNPEIMDNLADMQVRMRLLQTEVSTLRATLAEKEAREASDAATRIVLQQRLDALQTDLAALPAALRDLCPRQPAASVVTAQCEPGPDANRVVVSGDKLVVGEEERVWLDPPGAFIDARMAAGSEISTLTAGNVVEFERDGSKWVRFDARLGAETATVERAFKRYLRTNGGGASQRRPAVTLRVQLGDVRETVEVVLLETPGISSGSDESEDDAKDGTQSTLLLGRNFLTDVALVDVARKHVQPAFKAPK